MESALLTRPLASFWGMPPGQREETLLQAIAEAHAWHYERNQAYRHTVAARGVGPTIGPPDLPRILRPTAQTFKSYIEILGTPFPQEKPRAFLDWLADQLSIELPRERFARFRARYGSLEALLQEIERVFSDLGFGLLTSSGTSGRSTIMVRDQMAIDRTTESFYLSFQRYMGMRADHRMIFVMPCDTRIAMARMATFSAKRVGTPDERIHFTIPFPAYPDQVRIRAGRTFYPGWRGLIERKFWHPFMNLMSEHYVNKKAVQETIRLLRRVQETGEKLLLFGGWIQLHAIARELQAKGETAKLAPGSLVGTGGGLKERYPFAPPRIREDLAQTFVQPDGQPVPIHDTYGMAEANWAAMQCRYGNYHVPPWVYAVTLDEDGRFQEGPDTTGLLAFYDPFGGGRLFPAFFRSADRVRLINGLGAYDTSRCCPCGDPGTFISRDSIQRVDLLDEAGCAAQV